MIKLFLILVISIVCESKVLDVTTEKPKRGLGILNIQHKKTWHTTGFQLDCLTLFIDHYYYLEYLDYLKLVKYVSILRKKSDHIFGKKTDLAYMYMDSCDNIDNVNIEGNKFEMKLPRDTWAYFEDGVLKGKEFDHSQLPKTTWKSS